MSSYRYKIIIKTKKGFLTTKYRSPEKLQVGEELLIFYEGESHLVRVTTIPKSPRLTVEAEET